MKTRPEITRNAVRVLSSSQYISSSQHLYAALRLSISSSHFLHVRADSKATAALAFKKQCELAFNEKRKEKMRRTAAQHAKNQAQIVSIFKKEKDAAESAGLALSLSDVNKAALQAVSADMITDQLTKAFVTCGIAPFCLRNSEMKKALNMIAQHGKETKWHPPTERELMGSRLDKLDKEVRCALTLIHLNKD